MKNNVKFRLSSKRQVAFFITILTVLVSIGGYWYYGREKEQIIQQKEKTLTAIATLKAKEIEVWFKDALKDAQLISANPYLEDVAKSFVQSNSPIDRVRLLVLLNQIQFEHGYSEVFLTSLDGGIIAATNSQITTIYPDELRSLKHAIQNKETICTDFFNVTQNGNKQSLISFTSLINSNVNRSKYAIILRDDAASHILPLIESWPTESQTGESFIFNIETNSIILFN
jgi:nitrogen regulatory protein PII